MKHRHNLLTAAVALGAVAALVAWSGCSRDERPVAPRLDQTGPAPAGAGEDPQLEANSLTVVHNEGRSAPAGLVSTPAGGTSLTFWPYTGSSFDGSPVDPINVIFRGKADPVRIRAALLGLGGNRTAFGLPDAWPFNGTWTDCLGGNVQTGYAQGPLGWVGSVIQLQLGAYEPLRFHLRLFRTGVPAGPGGEWTLGGAHFEVLIPGTADHQVLSWEVAQQILLVDMMRTGLLDPAAPWQPSGPINAAPSFRTIPAVIYNGLPAELVALIQGPAQPVAADVPLASDGQATIFNLAGQAPVVAGAFNSSMDLTYNQIVPKPFCSSGPYDSILISGPITFTSTVTVNANGRYAYHSRYVGQLEGTPVDVTSGQPVPIGTPYRARVTGGQAGQLGCGAAWVWSDDRKLTRPSGGPELQFEWLRLPDRGLKTYRALTRCLDDDRDA